VTKWKKIFLLLATLLPIRYIVFFFAFMFSMLLQLPTPRVPDEDQFIQLMVAHIFIMFWLMAVFAWYCMILYRDPKLDTARKVIWAVAFLVTGPFGMVVFWYVELWRQSRAVV
jgi:hypothetical protein